jgi:hypothetical protein
MSYEEYMDSRSDRDKLQDDYISRIIDGMSMAELCQYMFDKLTEELNELSDDELTEQVSEYYPDLLEDVPNE